MTTQSAGRLDRLTLPKPASKSTMSAAETIAARRSCREVRPDPLTDEQISLLCWAGQGVTDRREGLRTAPSAGALFPITLLLADARGLFQYDPARHALIRLSDHDVRKDLQHIALDQSCVGDAPLCMIITFEHARLARKYGNRADRYGLIEAGHIAQNILLQATAMGLAGVPVGAFDEDDARTLLDLRAQVEPLYLLPIGTPVH
jgi:SagB-type dehydrogenase family enzyme